MHKARNPGLPGPLSRTVRFVWAAHVGRKDGRLGVPYDHFAAEAMESGGRQWTRFIGTVAAGSAGRRAHVMKSFIQNTRDEEGALLVAAGRVNDLTRLLRDAEPARAAAPPAGDSTFPLSVADVGAARREKAAAGRRNAIAGELDTARRVLAEKLSVYEAAVRRLRTDMTEVAWWANHVVAHYHQALDRAYLARKKREGQTNVRLPRWEPSRIEPDKSEEQLVLSGDLLSLLPPKIREVVEEALRHLAEPAGEGGVA
ncbi:hypothetical protein GCM10022226_65420 [Sphaerisporangium flaviroseum]|uniref:Uncharacterized protein n=1 Tax=Sphaerisporangium flaviroseum TaxID=509199 RepID=A0ABP7J5V9_9ACTN